MFRARHSKNPPKVVKPKSSNGSSGGMRGFLPFIDTNPPWNDKASIDQCLKSIKKAIKIGKQFY